MALSDNKEQDFYIFYVIFPSIVFALLTLLIFLFKSIFWLLVICCLYIISSFYGLTILQYINALLINLNFISDTFHTRYEIKNSCSICNNNSCKRHKLLPHLTKVKIPKDFDYALQQLFEDIVQKYVCTWYSDFSTNEAFVQQLRLAIITASKNITARLLQTDVTSVVCNQLIPLILQHAQDWKTLCSKAHNVSDTLHFQNSIICYFDHDIHPAAYSRKAELNYLRGIVTAIMPKLLPAIHVSTSNKVILREILANWILLPAIDAIADPENINALIMLSVHRDGSTFNYADNVNVPMLHCWMKIPSMMKITHNRLKPTLDEVLNDSQLLYKFMQHVKETGPMNLFQFCLDIDDLSKRMLNPDLSGNAENNLYTDIQNMYSTYLDPNSSEYLNLPEDISIGIQRILEKGSKQIQELRTSRPFYQAHQEAHSLLELTCLPSFHHSYQLYDLLCGQPVPDRTQQLSRASIGNVGTGSTFMKIGSQLPRLDGVLRTSTIDGMTFQDMYQGEEVDYPLQSYNEIKCTNNIYRDLTMWRVSIPHIDTGQKMKENGPTLFAISVYNIGEKKSWTVLRHDQDFYTLRTRLVEFHGDKELSDSPLPLRKNPHSSDAMNRQRYEDFLQKLLSKPVLRSSELLYNFLTMPNLKPYYTNYSTPDIGILYQSMTYKLRKEKGQNLDKFMTIFLASTNTRNDYMDVGVEFSSETNVGQVEEKGCRNLEYGIFGNNLDVEFKNRIAPVFPSPPRKFNVKGISFCIADAVDKSLHIPPTIARVVWMIAFSTRMKLDPFVNVWIYNALIKLLSSGRAATAIRLLHSKIMSDKICKKTTSQENHRVLFENTKKELYNLLPDWLIGIDKPWTELMDSVLDSLQNAPLNKHIVYILLDQIVTSLFPEL